ncbi:hypothetical protein ACHWQZ_G011696 [Mnemiopsis leidyi]
MRFISAVDIMLILMSNSALGTQREIPISSSCAKSWYRDDVNPDQFKPSNVHDKDYGTFYSVKDGDAEGNFLKLYFSDKYVVNSVDITNDLSTCCSNRFKNTAAFVYLRGESGQETEVKYCGKITDTSKGDNDPTNQDAQTYTIDCGGAVGNMIKIEDQDTGNLGHRISEVKVFGTGSFCQQSLCIQNGYDIVALQPGRTLTSLNGLVKLKLREDGLLQLFCVVKEIWNSGVSEEGDNSPLLILQTDQNLVVFLKENNSTSHIWNTQSSGENKGTKLEVTNIGNLELSRLEDGVILWETKTVCPNAIIACNLSSLKLSDMTLCISAVGLILTLLTNHAYCTLEKIPLSSSSALGWYKDSEEAESYGPSNVIDGNYDTFYSARYVEGKGNFLNLYFAELNTVFEVKITNRVDNDHQENRDRIKNTALYVYYKDEMKIEKEVKLCGKITDTSQGNLAVGDVTANTYTLDCGGAAGNMIRVVDEDTELWGHGISEVEVFKGERSYCEQNLCRGSGLNVQLLPDQALTSLNGLVKFTLKQDGNLYLYCEAVESWRSTPESEYPGYSNPKLILQTDNNLVVYVDDDSNNVQYTWHSHTYDSTNQQPTELRVTNTGYVELNKIENSVSETLLWKQGNICASAVIMKNLSTLIMTNSKSK